MQYKTKYIEVKVNNMGVRLNDSTLELSQQVAKLLDIKNGENVPCQIKIPHMDLMLLSSIIKYCCPFLIVYLFVRFS